MVGSRKIQQREDFIGQVATTLLGFDTLLFEFLLTYIYTVAPNQAIIPIPVSIALSSILNFGVCT